SESPNTTTRVSGFVASLPPSDVLGAAVSVTAAETAEAIVTGPFLSLPSLNSTGFDSRTPLRSVSAQLRALVSTIDCAVCPLTPPETGAAERASGYAVRRLNRWVIGCDG